MRPSARLTAALLCALLALPAQADEQWDSDWGQLEWERDIGSVAVFRRTGEPGLMRMFVEGLAEDVSGGRGTYSGVWINDRGAERCPVAVVDPVGGAATPYWGTFRLTFVETGFPSAWAGVWGLCTDTPTRAIAARPRTGG